MGGHTPLGYDTVDKKLVVNRAEAETVTGLIVDEPGQQMLSFLILR